MLKPILSAHTANHFRAGRRARLLNCASRLAVFFLLAACQPPRLGSPPRSLLHRGDAQSPTASLSNTAAPELPDLVFSPPPLPTATNAAPTIVPATAAATTVATIAGTALPAATPSPSPAIPLLLPDSEVVYSPSAAGFDVADALEKAGGFLSTHREYLRSTGWTSAADIITRVALENSINPRLLLSLLEYQCHCVLGQPDADVSLDHLLGEFDFRHKGLYRQLAWAAEQLSAGYYGWRGGTLREIGFPNGIIIRPAPGLNAGSVALQVFFSRLYSDHRWALALDPEEGLPALHTRLFGDPWERARAVEPLVPDGLEQPDLALPFQPGRLWSFVSGPHSVWETDGALAALDFAPAAAISGCVQTEAWVVAMADGLVVRSEFGAVVQDLSVDDAASDGMEQTGWSLLYMHIDSLGRVPAGTYLRRGDPVGRPSCEGGRSHGTHVHIARKFNGEWILAAGRLPFTLSGWVVQAGSKPYEGTLTRDGQTVVAHPYGSLDTNIFLSDHEP